MNLFLNAFFRGIIDFYFFKLELKISHFRLHKKLKQLKTE